MGWGEGEDWVGWEEGYDRDRSRWGGERDGVGAVGSGWRGERDRSGEMDRGGSVGVTGVGGMGRGFDTLHLVSIAATVTQKQLRNILMIYT